MADIISLQELADAKLDAQSLERFINGGVDEEVLTRLSQQYPTIKKLLLEFQKYNGRAYKTYAEMDADKANLSSKTKVTVTNDSTESNNGDWQWDGAVFTKSAYDPLTQSQSYTDDTVKNNTVLSGRVEGTEVAIFTDKNGRRTWLEIAADGGITERTKGLVRDVIFTPVHAPSFSYAVTDKNGRVLSAIYKDGSVYPKQSTTSVTNDKRFKILGIGNSFTQDAFMYVPFLLKEMGVTNFEIAVLYSGGSTLEQHWGFASNDTKAYDLQIYKSENEAWQSLGSRTLKEALSYTDFDTITLQQQSARSCDYTTYQPFLNNLIDYIYTNIDYPTRLGWLSIPASPDNGWSEIYPTSTQFYNAQVQAVENVLRDTPIEYVMPNNTAVQNARGTVLGELGPRSNMTYDGSHLQDGIPALVSAYASTLKWLEVFNLPKSIFGSRIAPTDDWLATKGILGQNGPSVGVTTSNILIAQKCAIAAIKNQFETSTIN